MCVVPEPCRANRYLRNLAVAVALLGTVGWPQSDARAQEVWQLPEGPACIEQWIRYAAATLNVYNGDNEFNSRKPWSINQYGLFVAKGISSAYEPDNWGQFGVNRNQWMWGNYTTEVQFPDWNNANFNGSRLEGFRYYVRRCVGRSAPSSPPPGSGILNRGGFACYGGAVFPDSWRSEASCGAFGCNFGTMSRDLCIALALEKGANEVIHGNPGGGRSNECWMQESCADLRPNADFTYFYLGDRSPQPPTTNYSRKGAFACFGGATFPASWRSEAQCVDYGCQFGRLGRDSCLALGARLGAAMVIHGDQQRGRSNECWLQNSCADLRPHADFSLYQ